MRRIMVVADDDGYIAFVFAYVRETRRSWSNNNKIAYERR